jgi:hypothetical protein
MHHYMHQCKMASHTSEAISNKSAMFMLVPGGGVEPPRPCDRRILSPLRLPVPPSRLYKFNSRKQTPRPNVSSKFLPIHITPASRQLSPEPAASSSFPVSHSPGRLTA